MRVEEAEEQEALGLEGHQSPIAMQLERNAEKRREEVRSVSPTGEATAATRTAEQLSTCTGTQDSTLYCVY